MNRNRHVPDVYSAAFEKACLESRKQGNSVVEQALADGSVKLTITVGGAS